MTRIPIPVMLSDEEIPFIELQPYICYQCGYVWMPTITFHYDAVGGLDFKVEVPKRCANIKCRSLRWQKLSKGKERKDTL